MDPNVHKALADKLYDKRKSGALEYVVFCINRLIISLGCEMKLTAFEDLKA
jgi:hypothetical protein